MNRVIVFVEEGAVQWVSSQDCETQVFVLDADRNQGDQAIACWEEIPRPWANVDNKYQTLISHYAADALFIPDQIAAHGT